MPLQPPKLLSSSSSESDERGDTAASASSLLLIRCRSGGTVCCGERKGRRVCGGMGGELMLPRDKLLAVDEGRAGAGKVAGGNATKPLLPPLPPCRTPFALADERADCAPPPPVPMATPDSAGDDNDEGGMPPEEEEGVAPCSWGEGICDRKAE
jgi:hypothetical protein